MLIYKLLVVVHLSASLRVSVNFSVLDAASPTASVTAGAGGFPPPSSLSSHEARRPEHSTSSAVLHERIDLIIDVIFGISN